MIVHIIERLSRNLYGRMLVSCKREFPMYSGVAHARKRGAGPSPCLGKRGTL